LLSWWMVYRLLWDRNVRKGVSERTNQSTYIERYSFRH
jgi:hypothetical protein